MKRTAAAWLAAIAGLLAYEAYAVFNGTPGDTLSEAVWKYGQHPMVAFCVGILVGHFWWQRRPPKALLVVFALPLLLGADKCSVSWPQPQPTPTTTPAPTPTPIPPPVNCLVTSCPGGFHCEQGIGCVADPLPPPEPVACPKALAQGATVYLNDKRYGNGIDSTVRVKGDLEFCRLIHGVEANDCHLEGWPRRAACEMELLGGCPVWQYSLDGATPRECLMAPHPEASCDHHGDPVDRDDPMTPAFEGRPAACGLQRDAAGDPMAGFFVIGHGDAYFRACLPDGTGCGPFVPGKDKP